MRQTEEGKRGKEKRGKSASLFSFSPLPLFLFLALLFAFAVSCKRSTENTPQRAAEAWDSGDYKLAADEYEQYIERNPAGEQSLDARFKLANIYYFNLRRYEQARAHYAALLYQDSSNPNAQVARERLAEVLGELGRSYEAISEYENLSPRDTTERRRIRLRIADLYFDQKNYSQALTEYDKVIESADYDDLSEQAYLREASIYNSRSQYQLSLVAYQKLASESNDTEVQMRATYGLVDCYAGLYQFDEAIKILRSIKDEREREHIAQRISELETQKREASQAKSGLQR